MKTQMLKGWKWMAGIGGGAVAILFCFGQGQKIEAQNSPAPARGDVPPISEANPAVTPAATVPVASPQVSPRVAEIAKLVQSGVSDDVLIAFIKNSTQAFNPTADEILYLTDLGMPDAVLTVLMQYKPALPEMTAPPVAIPPPTPAPVVVNPPQVVVTTNIIVNTETRYVQTAAASVTTFYEPLRPYGSWVDVEDYGLCWQPTVVVNNRDWRPYSDRGRWIYTHSGWYWQSDYSWGWAAFHYGRWHSSPRFGWVWTPDRVWAPAWVSWRYNNDYCGWAPLPPAARFDCDSGFSFGSAHVGVSFDFGLRANHYNFVPVSHFHDRSPNRFVVHGDQINNVYNNSTVINNYSVRDNTTVINEGIGRDRIASATHTRIDPVALRPTAVGPGALRRDVLDKQNNTLLVYRPPVDGASPNAVGNRAGRQEMIKLNAPIEKGTVPVRPNAAIGRPEIVRTEKTAEVKNGDADQRLMLGRPATQGRNYPGIGNESVNNNPRQAPVAPRTQISVSPAPAAPVSPAPRPVEKVERPLAPSGRNYSGSDVDRAPAGNRSRELSRIQTAESESSRVQSRIERLPVVPSPEVRKTPENAAPSAPVLPAPRSAAPLVRNYPGSDIDRAPVGNRVRESSRIQIAESDSSRFQPRIERPVMVPLPEMRNAPEIGRAPAPSYSMPPARSEPVFRPQMAPSLPPSQPVYRSEAAAVPSHGGQMQSAPAYRVPAYQPQPQAPAAVQRQAPVYSAPPQNNPSSRGDVPPNYRPDNGGRKFRNDQ